MENGGLIPSILCQFNQWEAIASPLINYEGIEMDDLIKALQILLKYGNPKWPTNCSHDVMAIMEIEPDKVSDEDIKELDRLGFFVSDEDGCFMSFKFGSA